MTKVFIATPAYDGKVHAQYSVSLADTQTHLMQNGIGVQLAINCGGSLLVAERNRLLMQFLESDCTHMLCIDSDLGWPCQSVISLILKDEPFIGGVYPTRKDNLFLFRPSVNEDKSIAKLPEKGLLKMEYIPAGFMLIKRCVIEELIKKFPETHYVPKDKSQTPGYYIFATEVWNGEFWGEDFVFCRRVRECGFDIFVDPYIEFDHAGTRAMLIQCLTNDIEKSDALR